MPRKVIAAGRSVSKSLTVWIGSIALALANSGVAVAVPVPTQNVAQSMQTADGWKLEIELRNLVTNSVPNMAAAIAVREGFVTGQAIASVEGDGSTPVKTGEVVLGVQIGCKIDLSSGANFGMGGGAGLGASGVGGLQGSSINAFLSPNFGINVMPGNIRTLVLGRWSLKGKTGAASVQDAHVTVDGCGGSTAIRFFGFASIDTDMGRSSVSTYADIVSL